MNRRVDDFVSHDPDWVEVVESADLHCWREDCDGQMVFVSYDWLNEALETKCAECGDYDWHSTERGVPARRPTRVPDPLTQILRTIEKREAPQ